MYNSECIFWEEKGICNLAQHVFSREEDIKGYSISSLIFNLTINSIHIYKATHKYSLSSDNKGETKIDTKANFSTKNIMTNTTILNKIYIYMLFKTRQHRAHSSSTLIEV